MNVGIQMRVPVGMQDAAEEWYGVEISEELAGILSDKWRLNYTHSITSAGPLMWLKFQLLELSSFGYGEDPNPFDMQPVVLHVFDIHGTIGDGVNDPMDVITTNWAKSAIHRCLIGLKPIDATAARISKFDYRRCDYCREQFNTDIAYEMHLEERHGINTAKEKQCSEKESNAH